MNCDDIKEKLKSFLDDLLAEDEYRQFRDHINTCDKCGGYVRSIGSLPNQLWKLGNVRVPSDLSSTIMYKLTHPKQEVHPSKFVISKKQIVVGFIFISLAIALFLGIKYFKLRQNLRKVDETPRVRTETIRKLESPSDSEAQSLIKQLETVATKLGVPQKDNATEEGSQK